MTKQYFPKNDEKRMEREPRSVFLFNLFAVLFTTFAVATVYWGACFWSAYHTSSKTRVRQVFTLNTIRHLATELEKYRNENKIYPDSLSDIHEDLSNDDAWRNPMIYTSNGHSWEIRSLGADGKEGGTGLNTDIVVNDRMYDEKTTKDAVIDAVPTFGEIADSFNNSDFGREQLVYGILLPVAVFLITSYYFFNKFFLYGQPFRAGETILEISGMVLVTSLVAAFLAFFHSIPSGH